MNAGDGRGGAALLGDRYSIVRELGRGGFGQTYLAKDRHRHDELCVIKEFMPQVDGEVMLAKAKELFEREAQVLYQLDHPQIPEFHQLVTGSGAKGHLFLVQDYVPGFTYQSLLESRQEYGGKFSETEITQLLYQLLPVLSYIHGLGLVHRDISPDNLILRPADGLPVLIDFGSVKAIAAKVNSELSSVNSGANFEEVALTRIGKVGYVPPEQMSRGEVDASSDLYGLAATLLVLVTGQDPQMLNDAQQGNWSGLESLSPKLSWVLRKMLATDSLDRFSSADAVLSALQADENPVDSAGGEIKEGFEAVEAGAFNPMYPSTGLANGLNADAGAEDVYEDGQVMAITSPEVLSAEPLGRSADSAANESGTYEGELGRPARKSGSSSTTQAIIGLLVTLGLVGTALLFFFLRSEESPLGGGQQANNQNAVQNVVLADGDFPPEEIARKEEIRLRREDLGIGETYFTRLVDQLFYQEYPTLLTSGDNNGRKTLTAAAADEPLRIRWDNLSLDLLDKLERNYSATALDNLGSYSEASREEWRSLIARSDVDERSLNDLVDAKFFTLFPSQAGRDFLTQPTGQLYYALAADRARNIASGRLVETVAFGEGNFSEDVSGELAPGEGRIYLLPLTAGQLLRLNLAAPAESTQLSLYLPEQTDDDPAVFADSEQTTWSGSVAQTGIYELVVVNRSSAAIDYQMAIAVDRVTSTPVAPPRENSSEETDDDTTENGNDGSIDSTDSAAQDNQDAVDDADASVNE